MMVSPVQGQAREGVLNSKTTPTTPCRARGLMALACCVDHGRKAVRAKIPLLGCRRGGLIANSEGSWVKVSDSSQEFVWLLVSL